MTRDIRAGQADVRIVVGPSLVIEGTILGNLEPLNDRLGNPQISWHEEFLFSPRGGNGGYSHPLNANAVVEKTAEGGRFTIRDLVPGMVTISAGERRIRTEIRREGAAQAAHDRSFAAR